MRMVLTILRERSPITSVLLTSVTINHQIILYMQVYSMDFHLLLIYLLMSLNNTFQKLLLNLPVNFQIVFPLCTRVNFPLIHSIILFLVSNCPSFRQTVLRFLMFIFRELVDFFFGKSFMVLFHFLGRIGITRPFSL